MLKLGFDANSKKNQFILIGFQLSGDHKILVDASDTIAGFLADKIKQGTNVSLSVQNVGGNEFIQVDIGAAIATKAYADSGDAATLLTAETFATNAANTAQANAEAYTDSKIPVGTKGSSLVGKQDGTYEVVGVTEHDINTDANVAPTVAQGSLFYVDATALTLNRTIMPDTTGAAERQSITFRVTTPVSGGGKSYSLVADIPLALTQKMIVVCVFKSGAWQIGAWYPLP